MTDYRARWAVLGACAVVVAIWLAALGVAFDVGSAEPKIKLAAMLLVAAGLCLGGARAMPRLGFSFAVVADLCLSVLQALGAITVLLPLSYLAATTDLPLVDTELARADAWFGFDWAAVAAFVSDRPALRWVMETAYGSPFIQAAALMTIGSLRRPQDRNSDLIWLFVFGLLLTFAVFVFVPAFGHPGTPGATDIDFLARLRRHDWHTMTYDVSEGIVAFPSFHTTLAIVLTYAARRERWALAVAAPLNAVMIASTPPVGGHYFVDLLGGAGVAAVAIVAVRAIARYRARVGDNEASVLRGRNTARSRGRARVRRLARRAR